MASPNIVYRAPQGDWKPEVLAGAIEKAGALSKIDIHSKKGLEKLANDYLGSYVMNLTSEEQVQGVFENYSKLLNSGTTDYVIKNLSGVVKYVGAERLSQLALNLPSKKGSGKNPKYDKAADLVGKLKALDDQVKAKDGVEKLVKEEFAKQDDYTKSFWISQLGGARGVVEHIQRKRAKDAIVAINDYGLADYMKTSVALSDAAEKDYGKAMGELQSKMSKDADQLRSKTGVDPSPVQIAEIRDKYKAQGEALGKKYGPLTGARKLITEGHGEEMPGVIVLSLSKYQEEKAKKEAEAKAKKPELKKAA
jgi:hypothetical protein